MLTECGIYNDVTAGGRAIVEKESGVVQLAIECQVPDGSTITAYLNIILKDGSLSDRTIKQLREAVGVGADPADWVHGEWPAFQIVVEEEEYPRGSGKMSRKVRWLNPNNATGGGGGVTPDEDALARLKAQHGARLRALMGGTPSAPKTAPKAAPKPAPPSGPTSTMEEVWRKWCEDKDGIEEHALYDQWAVDVEKHTGKAQNDCGPADWGKMMESLSMPF